MDIKQFLTEKLGTEGVKEIESAIVSIVKEKDQKILTLTENVKKAENEKGFLMRKIKAHTKLSEALLQKKLQEQKEFIIGKAEEYFGTKLKSKENMIESLCKKSEQKTETLIEKANKFFNSIIGDVKGVIKESYEKEEKEQRVMKLFKKAVDYYNTKKVTISDNVSDLREKVNSLHATVQKLTLENNNLRKSVQFLKETRNFKDEERSIVANKVKDVGDNKEFSKKLLEAKKLVLEKKRRPIIERNDSKEEKEQLVETVRNTVNSGVSIDSKLESKIIDLVEL
jgi:DNA repair exonuclease SbcCD ATPase subunit